MKIFLFSFLIIVILSIGTYVSAAATNSAYKPLVELPRMSNEAGMGAEDYVQALYFLSITIGALIAVVKIIFGGVQYMLSDVITSKEKAKKDIYGALLGLLIILSAVLILNTINPNLTKLNIFQNAPAIGTIDGPQVRTEDDQCAEGSIFTKTAEDPDGSCVQSVALEEDYTGSPGEGAAQCGNSMTYNPTTNTCDVIEDVLKLPDDKLTQLEEDSDGSHTIFLQTAREYCQSRGYSKFDEDNKSCI
jgi:hypothetical protein